MRPSSSVSPAATRSSPRKSSTVTPRAGSPRPVSRTCVEMLTLAGIVFLAGGRARAVPDPLRGVIRPRADRARRGRVGRDRLRQADPRLHLGPDLLDARPQPPAHRRGVRSALDEVVHLNSWMLSEPVLALGERLVGLFPSPLDRVLLLNTGTEANEVALKMAKMHTGRWEVVGLDAQLPRAALAGSRPSTSRWRTPATARCCRARSRMPAPYAYRCPVRHCDGACDCTCLEVGFELVDQQSVGSLCALVVEPVLSAGGIIVPARRLLPAGARAARRARDAAPDGRGPDGLRAPRDDVRLRARRRRARPRGRLEDARRRPAARGDDHDRARSSRTATTRASSTSPRTSPTRCPPRPASPCST